MRAPDAVAIQGALALHRTRKIRSRSALKNQIHSHLDLVFPGLSDALWNPIESKAGRIMLDEGPHAPAGETDGEESARRDTGPGPGPSSHFRPHCRISVVTHARS
jgi:hypothetical protein